MSQLHPGITKTEVVSVLGRPDGYKEVAGYEIHRYSNRLLSGSSWDRADYDALFKIFCRAVFFRLLARNFWRRISI